MALPRPDERTAEILGRTYQLPDVTASVVRELLAPATLAPPSNLDELDNLVANEPKETTMQTTPTTDPNAKLNGPHPAAPAEGGVLAFVKRHCTARNGVIASAVVLIGTALYFALTNGDAGDAPEMATPA